jgi:hypothetical protein
MLPEMGQTGLQARITGNLLWNLRDGRAGRAFCVAIPAVYRRNVKTWNG